jgi:hypothetical protein
MRFRDKGHLGTFKGHVPSKGGKGHGDIALICKGMYPVPSLVTICNLSGDIQ